jgi:bifunctional ADP-heptose synthase (sugar kinase/adenylyltransferase)
VKAKRPVLPDLTKARVLVVGDVMLDRYWFGGVSRISPEAPVPVVLVERSEERPGGAANVARNCASLGAKVSLLSVVARTSRGKPSRGSSRRRVCVRASIATRRSRRPSSCA